MTVNICLNSNSFNNSNDETIDKINERIDQLNIIQEKLDKINEKKKALDIEKDRVFKDNEIYNQKIYNNFYLDQFLYGNNNGLNINKIKLLRAFIDKSNHLEEQNIHKEIGFFNVRDDLVYTVEDLRNFYYKYFEEIENGTTFYNGIKIHFENLTLHENVEASLTEIQEDLQAFSKMIIKTLIYLNEKFKQIFEKHGDVRSALEELTEDLAIHSSVQGKNKSKLNFNFITNNGAEITLCCDPHIKYNRSEESTQDKEYYRLYFHTGNEDIDNGNILIAHIGIHL